MEELDESALASATKQLKREFTKLFTNVRRSLEKQNISAESLLSHLKTLEAIDREFVITKPMASDKPQMKTIESLAELFPAIVPYCSWFNHLLVENIIETFCEDDEKLLQKFKEYKDNFTKYCEARLCKCPLDQFGADHTHIDTTPVVMKIDQEWKTVKIKQIEVVRENIAATLKIQSHHLHLQTVRKGCVELVFNLPNLVATKYLPPSTKQITTLKNVGVTYIQYSHVWALATGDLPGFKDFEDVAMKRAAKVEVRENTAEIAERNAIIQQLQQELEHEQV